MKKIIKVLILNALLLIALPVFSQISVGIHIGPPPVRQEVIIARPYPEAVWVPGYYIYDPGPAVYVWKPGKWRRPPHRGAAWVAPEWRHERGEYHFRRGRWK